MRCPFCQHNQTSVVDSRTPESGLVIRRRRQCQSCGKRFTTFERISLAMPDREERRRPRRIQPREAEKLHGACAEEAPGLVRTH